MLKSNKYYYLNKKIMEGNLQNHEKIENQIPQNESEIKFDGNNIDFGNNKLTDNEKKEISENFLKEKTEILEGTKNSLENLKKEVALEK